MPNRKHLQNWGATRHVRREIQKFDLSLPFFGAINTSFFQKMHQNDFLLKI
jgi:hypothetical protein